MRHGYATRSQGQKFDFQKTKVERSAKLGVGVVVNECVVWSNLALCLRGQVMTCCLNVDEFVDTRNSRRSCGCTAEKWQPELISQDLYASGTM